MAISADRVVVELEAKLDRYDANVRRAQATFEKSMGRIGASATNTESIVARSASGMGRAFTAAFTGAFAIGAVRGFLGYADAAKQLASQLKLATATTGDYARAQKDVRDIAAATRSGLNETGQLYANIARNAKDLGLTQTEVAAVTTSVAQAFLISGSSAVEAAQGTRQLIQGLQSGTLRGDEFNSVMENAPRLAKLLADSLGVPIGQLRAMAEAGDLTAAKLTAALSDKRYTAALAEEFKQLPVTFGQAMVLVQNAAQETFSAFDSGGQFSTALANFVSGGADGFGDLATAAEQLGIDIASALAGLSTAFNPMLDGAASVFGSIRSQADGLARAIADILGAVDSAAGYVARVRTNASSLGNTFGGNFSEKYQGTKLAGNFMRGYGQRKNELTMAKLRRTGLTDFPAPDRDPGPARVIPGKAKKAGRARKGPSAESIANKAERARLQQEREDGQYASDLARLNESILQAKAALVTAADAVAAYEIEEIKTTRDRINAGYAAEVSQKTMRDVQAQTLTLKNNELAALKIKAVEDREAERKRADTASIAQADLQNQADLANSGAQLADTREAQRDAALRILELQFQIERAELENVIASQQSTEAQKEIARRRLAILGQLEAGERTGVERENEGPMDRYKRELGGTSVGDQLENVEVDAIKNIGDMATDAAAKYLELEGVVGQVANSIIKDLIRIAIQQAITFALGGGGGGGIFGSIFGGGGATLTGGGSGPSIPMFGRASGGHVVPGKMYPVNEGGGTEGFQPAASGKIIPLGRMNQAGGNTTVVQQSFTLDARGGVVTEKLLRDVDALATQRATQAGKASFDASQKAAPARIDRYNKLGQ